MNTRLIAAGAVGAIALTAVVAVAQSQTGDDESVDRAAREPAFPVGIESVREQAASEFGDDASKFNASPVPVLAPPELSADQRAQFATRFIATPDGYSTYVTFDAFDLVINGTRNYGVSAQLIKEVTRGDVTYLYEESVGARSASWLHAQFNTDYLLEFECTVGNGGDNTCVTEDFVLDTAENMVLVGGAPQ